MSIEIKEEVKELVVAYDSAQPAVPAGQLRELWLQFEPKSTGFVKAEQRQLQEVAGTPVAVLRTIGQELGQAARKQVEDYIPLARLLWDAYGREGRIVAAVMLSKMELADPERVVPLVMVLCRSCYSWEDADQLAMNGLEPIVRKQPETWLPRIEPWLEDENMWVRRAGVTVVGRLPMKQPEYAGRCLALAESLLLAPEVEVKKAVSFAIRLTARGSQEAVRDFLARQVPPQDPAATWVLCDAIRSMAKSFLPAMAPLLPLYEGWAADPGLDCRDRRSVESAIKVLKKAQ